MVNSGCDKPPETRRSVLPTFFSAPMPDVARDPQLAAEKERLDRRVHLARRLAFPGQATLTSAPLHYRERPGALRVIVPAEWSD